MSQILFLFPEIFLHTNLFIQCRPLDELDWSAWNEFDEVHLIVSRPVQREIDNQKNRGNDRVGIRARRTHSLFRQIIVGAPDYKLIRDADSQVKLFIEPSCLPDPELADRLYYIKPDDTLVGCLHTYRGENPVADARLLTHDSGPMGSAKMLGLPFIAIPDDWLVPPESTEAERTINRLENEVARLKKAEPEFHIACLGGEGTEIDRLELDYQVYDPLTEDEVSKFIESLKSRFPLATDFRSKEPAERDPTSRHRRITGMKDIYTPASDDEITEYTETTYPAWVESCRKTLADLHGDMQREIGPPAICFVASNEGTRPGKDALTTIQASGNFKICPPDPDENDRQEEESETKIELPPPPDPPQGKWTTTFGGRHRNALTGMAAF